MKKDALRQLGLRKTGTSIFRLCSCFIAAAVVIGVSACGSSSSGGSSTSTPASTSNVTAGSGLPKPNGSPIKLFQIYEQNSTYQTGEAGYNGGAEAAVAALNKTGGIGGHPVQLITCDDNSQPNLALKCAKQALQEKVLAVIASSTLYTSSIGPLLSAAHIPYIGGEPNSSYDATNPDGYPIGGLNAQNFAGLAFALKAAGAKQVAVVAFPVPAAAYDAQAATTAIKRAGMESTGVIPIAATASDMSPYVLAAQHAGADGTILVLNGTDDLSFLKAARSLAPEMLVGFEEGDVSPAQVRSASAEIPRMVSASAFPPAQNPGNSPGAKQFTVDMQAAKAAGVRNATELPHAIVGWLDVQALAQLAKGSPETVASSQALTDALNKQTQPINLMGLTNWAPGAQGPSDTKRMGTSPSIYFDKYNSKGEPELAQAVPIDLYSRLGVK